MTARTGARGSRIRRRPGMPTRIPPASRAISELDARRTLLAGLWDYAGMFPPAELPLEEARAEWQRIRASDDAWLVNWFVVRGGGDVWGVAVGGVGAPG